MKTLNELSKKTLASYAQKAVYKHDDLKDRDRRDSEEERGIEKTARKRRKKLNNVGYGIHTALKKLGGTARVNATEHAEEDGMKKIEETKMADHHTVHTAGEKNPGKVKDAAKPKACGSVKVLPTKDVEKSEAGETADEFKNVRENTSFSAMAISDDMLGIKDFIDSSMKARIAALFAPVQEAKDCDDEDEDDKDDEADTEKVASSKDKDDDRGSKFGAFMKKKSKKSDDEKSEG